MGIDVTDFPRRFSTELAGQQGVRIRHTPTLWWKACTYELKNLSSTYSRLQAAREFDLTWLSRNLVVGYPTFEPLLTKPLVFDLDDAVFLNGRLSAYQYESVLNRADLVVAGNSYLAEYSRRFNSNVVVVPTSVDTNRWKPVPNKLNEDIYVIGWSGTSSSFKYLKSIQVELVKVCNIEGVEFRIMSDRFPSELEELAPYVRFSRWNEIEEVSFIQNLDVGIMPMHDDEWVKGKCAYKMLLYAACAKPVVVSPFGMNAKILEEADVGIGVYSAKDWYDSLFHLSTHRELGYQMGVAGATLVKNSYSLQKCSSIIAHLIKDIL